MNVFKKFKNKLILVLILVMCAGMISTKEAEAQWVVTDPYLTAIVSTHSAPLGVTSAQTTADTVISIKNVAKEILKVIGRNLARKALQGITTSINNWVNSGFHGAPLFLENPGSFFKDIVKSEIKDVVTTFGYDSLRFPFGRQFSLNLINSYKNTLEDNAQYSLSKLSQDQIYVNNFRTDFSVGGWDGLLLNTQYPQNNPIGFNMTASEEVARRLAGSATNKIDKVRDTLEQGQGFLSPQNCPSNPSYYNNENPYQKNPFRFTPDAGLMAMKPDPSNYPLTIEDIEAGLSVSPEYVKDFNAWQTEYTRSESAAQASWSKKNVCPGGLANTTPGALVAKAAMEALNAPQENVYAAMVSGSLASIFDNLLNKFLGDGLNALATKVNPRPEEEEFTYEGLSLGTTNPYGSTEWNAGPDEVIVLSEFKEKVADGISLTTDEITLIDNTQKTFNLIWPETQRLDQCVPGPDKNWRDRLESEEQRNGQKFMQAQNSSNGETAALSKLASQQLKYAVSFFRDWIDNRMLTVLPNSVDYLEAVDSLDDVYQKSKELIDRKRIKVQALARLRSIQSNLSSITSDPIPGSNEEARLVDYWKQYKAVEPSVGNAISVEDTRNDFNTADDQLQDLQAKTGACLSERSSAGWSDPDPSGQGTATGIDSEGRPGTEKNLFCNYPIIGGFSHGDYVDSKNKTIVLFKERTTPPAYPDTSDLGLPIVNALKVPFMFGFFGINVTTNMDIKCNIVWRATVLDYKQNIPGLTGPINEVPGTGGTSGGLCAEPTGNKYAGELRAAMDAVVAANPAVANLPNVEVDVNGRGMKLNARQFLDLVAAYINAKGGGWNATADVLNGGNNTSTGDIIAIWKSGDKEMERYDAIRGGSGTVAENLLTDFAGFVPLNCTASGGGTECGCKEEGGIEIPPVTVPPGTNPPPASGNAVITSISPMTAAPGVTTITINGTNLTNQVSFFDGGGGRNTVVGTVNSAKTQTTVLVPDGQPIGNATVKIYQGNNIWSNGILIAISTNGSVPPPTSGVAPSVNATSGWLGNAAYNSTNNTWMVISGGTYGRIMGNNLTPITPEFKLNTNTGSTQALGAKVAYSPNINKYLAVWVVFDLPNPNAAGQIYGRFVNPDGTFSGNVFSIFKDSSGSGATAFYANSTLQYDGKNKKFVMVWNYDGVKLVTISESGVPGTPIQVVSGLTAGYLPSVAVSENNNEYCVAYDKRSNSPRKVATKKVNAATLSVGAENSLSAPGDYMSIAYNTTNNQYLVGWGEAGVMKGRILKSCNINDLSSTGGTFTIQSAGATGQLAYNSRSNTYASIVQNQTSSANAYNILSATGAKIKEGTAFTGGFGNFAPTIAANTTDGTFAATSSYEYATTRFAPNLGTATSSGGGSSGTVSNPIKKDLGVGTFPDPVFYNGRLYVAVQQNDKLNIYNWDMNLNDQKVQSITFSGVGQAFPRLTVHNNIMWMVFRNGNNSPGSSVPESIKLWRSDTGGIEDLGQVTNSGNDPVAIGNGYVAWQKQVSGVIKVLRRPLTGGTVATVRNGAPTGISRILTDGSVILIDTDRTAVSWGLNAWFAGTLTVAADVTPYDDNGVVGRFNNVSSTEFNIWLNERTQTPHAATDGAGNYAIATWNPTARVAIFKKP